MGQRFEERVGIVTGGSQGIGEAVVRRFHAEGGSVVAASRDADRLAMLAAELGERFVGVPTDVTKESDLKTMVSVAVESFGGLHLAVNVAGAAKYAPITELTEDDWDYTNDVCARGVAFSMKHEAAQMVSQGGGGAIVNIASLNSVMPLIAGASYSAAKAAVVMMTQVAAIEVAQHGLRVNAVSPGLTETPQNDALRANPVLNRAFLDRIPLARAAHANEIAAAALWLASDDSAYVTGTNLLVDGGWALSNYPNARQILAEQRKG